MKTEQPLSPAHTGLVTVRGLHKIYRRGPEEVHALRGVTLSLTRRELVALVGPSGSGKSTLLNVLAGWESADEGEIRWEDGWGSRPADRSWSDLAIVPQRLGLFDELTVRENVALPIRLLREHGDGAGRASEDHLEERVGPLLRVLGLAELADRIPPEVSLGEQQRTAVARALVLLPRLVLLDEPTGHQDEGWARIVMGLLWVVADKGVCCLVATHNPDAARFADRVLSIRDGVVEQAGG